MRVVFGKRLEVLVEGRLVKKSGKETKRGWRIQLVGRVCSFEEEV